MGFFDSLGKKASAAYDATAEKTGKLAKEAKLRMKINENKSDINDLYKDDTLFIPRYIVNIEGVHGGSGNNYINSENYNTLTIGSRTRSGVAGTTYWRIRAFKDANCTETSILLDTTEASNSIETFDVSEYKCVALEVYCTATNGVVAWYSYDFNDIKLYR